MSGKNSWVRSQWSWAPRRTLALEGNCRFTYPRTLSWNPQTMIGGWELLYFVLFYYADPAFFCNHFGAIQVFLRQAWAEGKGELATCCHCGDSRRETWIKGAPA